MTNSPHRDSGISLIELLVVLALLAVIAGVAVPVAYTGLGSFHVQSASRRIAATMRLAHDSAVAARTEHRITFDVETGRYQLLRDATDPKRLYDPEAVAAAERDEPDEDGFDGPKNLVSQEDLPEGVAFLDIVGGETDSLPTFRFSPQGHSSGGEVLVGDDRIGLRVILERPASRVRIERGDSDERD